MACLRVFLSDERDLIFQLARARAQTFMCFRASSNSNIYMFLSKLELGLEHLYGFEQARAQAQAFLCFRASSGSSSKLFFLLATPCSEVVSPSVWCWMGGCVSQTRMSEPLFSLWCTISKCENNLILKRIFLFCTHTALNQ